MTAVRSATGPFLILVEIGPAPFTSADFARLVRLADRLCDDALAPRVLVYGDRASTGTLTLAELHRIVRTRRLR